ncbi:hypothetical protein ABLO27_02145 [Roseibium sp. SCPC15]|uniref:hypothetical protein n=1 Tax=Roseibium sp. SCP15 TaxID=3141376 RepID=UPI0033378CC5
MDFRSIFDVAANMSELAVATPDKYSHLKTSFARDLEQIDPFFGKAGTQPCPICFRVDQVVQLKKLAETLHGIIETVTQMYVNGNAELLELFSQYAIYKPFMIRQLEHFQVYGRYDFLVNTQGNIVFLETNSAMPGGFIPVGITNDRFANRISGEFEVPHCRGEYSDPGAELGGSIKRMMRKFSTASGAIAIVTDENQKYNEINLIRGALEGAGLTVYVGPVDELQHRIGYRMSGEGEAVTALYNKMRLFGSKHSWKAGALSHHHGFLEAVSDNNVLLINNVAAMTITEDKAIFAAFRLPSVRAALSDEENAFIDAHTPESFLLDQHSFDGEYRGIFEEVLSDPEEWIVKPRNDYQGLGASSGRDHTKDSWTDLVRSLAKGDVPYLAQRRVDSFLYNSAQVGSTGAVSIDQARLAGGIYYRNGKFGNIVGRASTAEIANVSSGAAYLVPVVYEVT